MISHIVYSHSSYYDVLTLYMNQYIRLFSNNFNKYLFSDIQSPNKEWDTILYKNEMPYKDRLIHCLSRIESEYILFDHEDMILYDRPNYDLLIEYIDVLKNSRYNFVRLLASGIGDVVRDYEGKLRTEMFNQINNTLYEIPNYGNTLPLSIQSSIFKKSNLIELLKTLPNSITGNVGPSNIESLCLNKKDYIGLFHYNNENARGGHFDSNAYPYIATAITKGKWNYNEYKNIMNNICQKYNIDINNRGYI